MARTIDGPRKVTQRDAAFRQAMAKRGRRQQPTPPSPPPKAWTKNELIGAYLRGEQAGPDIVRESWGATEVETRDYDTSPSTLWDASCNAMQTDVRERIGTRARKQPEGLQESFAKGAEAAAKACLSLLCDEHPLDRCGEKALEPWDGVGPCTTKNR